MSDKENLALIAKLAANAQEYYTEAAQDALLMCLDNIEVVATWKGDAENEGV